MATSYPGGIDNFTNPGPTSAEDDPNHDEQHADANDAIEAIESELGPNPSGDYSTVGEAIANAIPIEVPWTPYGTPVWADEFVSSTMDSGWVRVDASGKDGHATWTQGGGAMSLHHNSTADTASELHAIMYPIDTMVVGDAIQTATRMLSQYDANYAMSGLVLADGVTHGAGTQVIELNYIGSTGFNTSIRSSANYASDTTYDAKIISKTGVELLHTRIVMTAANTWRHDMSLDGVSWHIGAATAPVTLTPTHAGLLASNWGTTQQFTLSHQYIRRYSGVS